MPPRTISTAAMERRDSGAIQLFTAATVSTHPDIGGVLGPFDDRERAVPRSHVGRARVVVFNRRPDDHRAPLWLHFETKSREIGLAALLNFGEVRECCVDPGSDVFHTFARGVMVRVVVHPVCVPQELGRLKVVWVHPKHLANPGEQLLNYGLVHASKPAPVDVCFPV